MVMSEAAVQKFQIQYLKTSGEWQTTRTFKSREAAERAAQQVKRNLGWDTRVIQKD